MLCLPILAAARLLEATDDFVDVLIRREDWIKNMLDSPSHHDQCQALEQANAVRNEGGKSQRLGKGKGLVAQKRKGQMEPTVDLALIICGLSAQPE